MHVPRLLAFMGAFSSIVLADSITPSSFSGTLNVGESVTIRKTVTVTQQTTTPVDVFFLTDTTGSMSGAINSVKMGFGDIVSSISALAPNTAFGVGDYRDTSDAWVYLERQDLTTNTANVQTALNALSAGGGGDTPEANIYALEQAAKNTSWRTGSQRFLVWTGDAPGHDPSNGSTEATALAALQAEMVRTYAIAVGGSGLDSTGQATRISSATGGELLSGGYTQAADLIEAALSAAVLNYTKVSLGLSGPYSGIGVTWSPVDYVGTYDRSIERQFQFDVTFTGLTEGTYSFATNALVDGAVVATELDSITVGTPEPGTYALLGSGLFALIAVRRHFGRGQGSPRS